VTIQPAYNYLVPTVVEQTNRGERAFDLYSRLLKEQHHLPGHADRRHDRQPGVRPAAAPRVGEPRQGHQHLHQQPRWRHHRAVRHLRHDAVRQADITTICFGQAASAAAVLLAAGTKGKRLALPHARVLLHQPYASGSGQATDIEIQAKEIMRMRDLLEDILAEHTGQDKEKLKRDTDRDFVLSAAEAKEYGIIDEVISTS
jgi:ATP-dependent Clp protease protease subunit